MFSESGREGRAGVADVVEVLGLARVVVEVGTAAEEVLDMSGRITSVYVYLMLRCWLSPRVSVGCRQSPSLCLMRLTLALGQHPRLGVPASLLPPSFYRRLLISDVILLRQVQVRDWRSERGRLVRCTLYGWVARRCMPVLRSRYESESRRSMRPSLICV